MAAHYRAFAPAGFAGYVWADARSWPAIIGQVASAIEPARGQLQIG